MLTPSPESEKVPGWVTISASPTASLSTQSVSVPIALCVPGSSPVLRNSALSTCSPRGTSRSEETFWMCSPSQLYT